MRAIDDPLSKNVTRGCDDFRWVEDTKGSAVPENRTRHSRNTQRLDMDGTDESCARVHA